MHVLALLTQFRHHRPDGAYKRLVAELAARHGVQYRVFGNNENDPDFPHNALDRAQMNYKWVAEWRALGAPRPDLVHAMYGEEYYRFSHRLFPRVPIVATFHHPAAVLEREVAHGDHGGRVAALTHRLNRGRFRALAAAIVTHPDQRDVLRAVMPEERIHVIPLGVDVPGLPAEQGGRAGVLTLGNWFRDWDVYLAVVQAMPEVDFHLVNRQLPEEVAQQLAAFPHVQYHRNVSDAALLARIQSCSVAFLPLLQLAGSNALLECLAGGLPVVMSDVNAGEWDRVSPEFVERFQAKSPSEAAAALRRKLSTTTLAQRRGCVEIAKTYSWPEVARRTYELFERLI